MLLLPSRPAGEITTVREPVREDLRISLNSA